MVRQPKSFSVRRSVVRLLASVALSVGVVICSLPPVAVADLSSTPQPMWMTNGEVDAIVAAGERVYLGGDFSYVGPDTGSGVAVSRSGGEPVGGRPRINGRVDAVVSDGRGGYFIGGTFSRVGTTVRANVARLRADGTLDPAWSPTVATDAFERPEVLALAVSGDTVYVAGSFDKVSGVERANLAAIDARTGLVSAWNPSPDDPVFALAVSGNTLYAGGTFSQIGGQPRNTIAALDTRTGAATAWNPNPSGDRVSDSVPAVMALAVSGQTVYAGGNFTRIGGQARNLVAALEVRSGRATGWNPHADLQANAPHVAALAVSGNTLYVGGEFTTIGGQRRASLAAVSRTTGRVSGWNPRLTNSHYTANVNVIRVAGRTVYVGGIFHMVGRKTRNHVAAISARTGVASAWTANSSGTVSALAVGPDNVFVGGEYSSLGGRMRYGLAALNIRTGAATAWHPSVQGGIVKALALSGSMLYVGGTFDQIAGRKRSRIAAVNARSGAVTSWNPHAEGSAELNDVSALAVSRSIVYAGGGFNSIGGKPRHGIAALDAHTGAATPWNPKLRGTSWVTSLAVSGRTLYVGGAFDQIAGRKRSRIAAVDTHTGTATAWNPRLDSGSSVYALAVSGSTVYVAGQTDGIGGQPRTCVLALDAISGAATAWNPDVSNDPSCRINALVVAGRKLYVGGVFRAIGGQPRNNLAALDTTSGSATPWNPNVTNVGSPNASVSALAVFGTNVYVGGAFTRIGQQFRQGFAAFSQTH